MEAEYKNGEKIEFVENTFDLTEKQKTLLSDNIKKITKLQHSNIQNDKNKIRTKLTPEQKESILKLKNNILASLKELSRSSNDLDFIKYLKDNNYIRLTEHANDRIVERFGMHAKIDKGNPFSVLELDKPLSSEELGNDVIRIFIESDSVGDRAEWPAPIKNSKYSFSRIRLKESGEKTTVVTEITYGGIPSQDLEFFIIITVI